MVELGGLEPQASSMPWKRSSQLSYSPINKHYTLMVEHGGVEPPTSSMRMMRSTN